MGVSVSAAMASTTQDSIVKACEWRWHEMAPALPKMADDEPATLMKLAVAGLRKRLSNKEFGYTPPASEHRVYVDRLKYEMETLTRTGFCGYFLMVRDLMNHSRETGIPVGPVVVHPPALWWHGASALPTLTLSVMACCSNVSLTLNVSTCRMLIWTLAGPAP